MEKKDGYEITCTHMLPVHSGFPGQYSSIDYWTVATIAPCPNCGGPLLWAENGYVPGYRICELCGRSWMVNGETDHAANTVKVRLTVPDTASGPEWNYGEPDKSDEAYDFYVSRVSERGGRPARRETWEHYQS